ncbi:hypothetical protein DM860_016244 [Cuscuta australis]|uniref:Uncharacterized protein n=1 Tax=Cuscuta australis TaxID=267555 RepID=A0A328E8S3_9ASTE|nr:hypothetical protein DM860_016244 [Cuscuta australis]
MDINNNNNRDRAAESGIPATGGSRYSDRGEWPSWKCRRREERVKQRSKKEEGDEEKLKKIYWSERKAESATSWGRSANMSQMWG